MTRFDIDDIHDELQAGRDITASQALVYAQHHIAIAIADEREACAKIADGELMEVHAAGEERIVKSIAEQIRARNDL